LITSVDADVPPKVDCPDAGLVPVPSQKFCQLRIVFADVAVTVNVEPDTPKVGAVPFSVDTLEADVLGKEAHTWMGN
jgi:hypothetical protein